MTDTSSRWKATLHIGGLAPTVTTTTIHHAFIPFGEIVEIKLPKNEEAAHRGFAYVEFEDADDAIDAIDNMDQAELFGRVIKVSPAKPPKSADEGLGSKTAVWEQESWIAKHAAGEDEPEVVDDRPDDPMQGLEEMEAGPKPQ